MYDSCFLFAVPDIPFNSTVKADSETVCNSITGNGYLRTKFNSSSTTNCITYNCGITGKSAEYFIIGRADLLKLSGATSVTLEYSDDNITWVNVTTVNTPFQITGNRNDTYFETFADTGNHQYWRVCFNSIVNTDFNFGKIFFGNFLDPIYSLTNFTEEFIDQRKASRYATSGYKYKVRTGLPLLRYKFTYNGLDDVAIRQFKRRFFLNWQTQWAYVWNTNRTHFINEKELIYGRVSNFRYTKTAEDYYNLTFDILEDLQ